MNPSTPNPYASSAASELIPSGSLHGLLAWLTIACFASAFGTPSDWASELTALSYGLLCLVAGLILTTSLPVATRVLPLIVWGLLPAALMQYGRAFHYASAVALFGAMSVVMGATTLPRAGNGHARILALFCVGYLSCAIIGATLSDLGMRHTTVVGALAGAVAGTLLSTDGRKALRRAPFDNNMIDPSPQTRVT